jgi:glycine/D-amino acid oxidase-like deaminating enzyme
VVDFLSSREIGERFSFQRPAALLSHLAGEVDAFRLTHKLIAQACRLGLEAYDRTFVVKLAASGDAVELHTGDGHRIQAKRVVFATGYETPRYLDQKIVKLTSTFALATAPVESFEGWGEDRCLIWETARPYFYARTTGDGRVIMGGADEPFATAHKQEKLISLHTRSLETALDLLFPAFPID